MLLLYTDSNTLRTILLYFSGHSFITQGSQLRDKFLPVSLGWLFQFTFQYRQKRARDVPDHSLPRCDDHIHSYLYTYVCIKIALHTAIGDSWELHGFKIFGGKEIELYYTILLQLFE